MIERFGAKMEEQVEVTLQELDSWEPDSYVLVDIRDAMSFSYGHLPNAIHVPKEELDAWLLEQSGKKVVLYCKKGETSKTEVERLREKGYGVCHLAGGYLGWLMDCAKKEEAQKVSGDAAQYCKDVEQSIRKKFRKPIWCKFTKAINQYELVKEGDKIAVCISGGKDSMLMAKLFQELKRHNKFHFDLVFLVMDPGYSPENLQLIRHNAEKLQIPVEIFETDIFDSVFHVEKSPCYLCARMRRGHLYNRAKELGCNKIALGHHYDDVIETILMGMLYGAQVQTMMPKLHSTNFEGMQLIRPMYLIREDDIKAWRDYNKLQFLRCACRFTETCDVAGGESSSARIETKRWIAEMKKTNPFVEGNIFRSVENVNLSTVIAYKQDGIKHHFLDEYED